MANILSMSILHGGNTTEVGSPVSILPVDPTSDLPLYVGEDCPISWPVSQTKNINSTYPFHGVDPEDQPLEEFAYRKYLDTLWLPETLFPLQGFIQELRRAFTHLTSAPAAGNLNTLHGLVKPFMLSCKQITKKYDETIPEFLSNRANDPQDEEEKMIVYAAKFEKGRSSGFNSALGLDEQRWLTRFRRREAQIQLLLRLLLLSYPDDAPESSPTKRKRGRRTHSTVEAGLERLLDLMTAWIAMEEPDPSAIDHKVDDGGWAGRFCETIVAPLFKEKLPGECDMCVFSLCPGKYNTPPSSEPGSPVQQHSALLAPAESMSTDLSRGNSPFILTDEHAEGSSRGVSPFIDSSTNLQERSRSRSLSRTRSASIFSLGGYEGEDANGIGRPALNVNRGGLGAGKTIFREVEMRKSAKDIKERKPIPKPKPKPRESAKELTKRTFARSATVPLKQSTLSAPMLLVAETPNGKRFRTTSPDAEMAGVEDSPDALLLRPVFDTPSHQGGQKVFIPETPLKQ